MADVVKSLFKVILGILLIIVVLYLVINYNARYGWWSATLTVLKGGIVLLVVLIGLVLLLVGFSDMRSE